MKSSACARGVGRNGRLSGDTFTHPGSEPGGSCGRRTRHRRPEPTGDQAMATSSPGRLTGNGATSGKW